MDFIEKVKGFLLEPGKTFEVLKEEPLKEAVKYYVIIATIYSAISALLLAFAGNLVDAMMGIGNFGTMLDANARIGVAISIFVLFMIIAIAGAFIGGAILHIFVLIVGGSRGIVQTIKVVMYGNTAFLLFSWIPISIIIAATFSYSMGAEIYGIHKLHEFTIRKAFMAVFLPIIILIILTILYISIFPMNPILQ